MRHIIKTNLKIVEKQTISHADSMHQLILRALTLLRSTLAEKPLYTPKRSHITITQIIGQLRTSSYKIKTFTHNLA